MPVEHLHARPLVRSTRSACPRRTRQRLRHTVAAEVVGPLDQLPLDRVGGSSELSATTRSLTSGSAVHWPRAIIKMPAPKRGLSSVGQKPSPPTTPSTTVNVPGSRPRPAVVHRHAWRSRIRRVVAGIPVGRTRSRVRAARPSRPSKRRPAPVGGAPIPWVLSTACPRRTASAEPDARRPQQGVLDRHAACRHRHAPSRSGSHTSWKVAPSISTITVPSPRMKTGPGRRWRPAEPRALVGGDARRSQNSSTTTLS